MGRKRPVRTPQAIEKDFYREIFLRQEEEKKRVSQDLHDESGQTVVALTAALSILEKAIKAGEIEEALAEIEKNRRIIQEMASKIKSIALRLRPPALDMLGLAAVLREYFSQCTQLNPLKIEFNENTKGLKLNENIEIALYRIVQESITNIIKYSGASLVKIDLFLTGAKVQLVIKDNGKGFDLAEYQRQYDITKMGLRGIKERVDFFGGTFNIVSGPKSGTELNIVLPLNDLK